MILAGKRKLLWPVLGLTGICLVIVSCRPVPPAYLTLDGQAQGTTFHISYSDSLARDFSGDIDSLFRLVDRSMSLWDSTSLISRINRNDTTVRVDEHFQRVFNRSLDIAAATAGAFDITVGPLVRAWGFSAKHQLPLPDSNATDSLLELTGYQKVWLEKDRLLKEDPRIQLDLNAIAQGYTVDLISDFLEANGIRNYLVEIGGEVRAHGVNSQHKNWQVGIDQPVDTLTDQRPLQAILPLRNQALATSGSYRKYLQRDGIKWSHIIDPATGYPTHDSLLSVSVLAPDAMTADACATAFLVRGLEYTLREAQRLEVEAYCIYKGKDGTFYTAATSGFFP